MTEKKIRATLGESVVVGVEIYRSSGFVGDNAEVGHYILIRPSDRAGSEVTIWLNDGWAVEYIQELPTLPGAIVKNVNDNSVYVRHTTDSQYTWYEVQGQNAGEVWGDDTVAEGGFEVLFEGVE